MFLVPAYEDGPNGRKRIVGLGRIEEKLGHHASVTAQLDFERAPAMLIGERGAGLRVHAAAHEQRAARRRLRVPRPAAKRRIALAAGYAAERKSMGKSIDKHEMIADYLDEMRTDAQALRALCVHGAFHEELAQKKLLIVEVRGAGGRRQEAARARDRAHKRCGAPRDAAAQVFRRREGGRDRRAAACRSTAASATPRTSAPRSCCATRMVMPIYEGTSQIQALMAMKDTLGGILKNPQRFVRRGAQARWRSLSSRDGLERAVARIQTLSFQAQQHLILRTAGDKLKATADKPLAEWPRAFLKNWNPEARLRLRDAARRAADAHARRRGGGASCCSSRRRRSRAARAAERWVERAEPRCRHLVDEITSTGDRLLAKLRRRRSGRRWRRRRSMSVHSKFIRYQGPVLRGMGEAAVGALKQRLGEERQGDGGARAVAAGPGASPHGVAAAGGAGRAYVR